MKIQGPLLFRDMNPLSKLFFGAFVALVTFLAVQLITVVIAFPVFGFEKITQMLTGIDFNNPGFIPLLKFFQIGQTVGLFIFPAFILAWLYDDHPTRYLYLRQGVGFLPAVAVFLMVFLINPFINFAGSLNAEIHLPHWLGPLEEWMRKTEEAAVDLTEAFVKTNTLGGLSINLLMIAVLPALGEELLFRGIIQKLLTELTKSPHGGIWISAAFFSALHLQFLGFIPRMILGGLFGYLLYWSGSLWLPILAHFVNNAVAVIGYWLIERGMIDPSFEEFGTGMEHWYYAAASLLLTLFSLIAIRQILPPGNKLFKEFLKSGEQNDVNRNSSLSGGTGQEV